MLLFFLMLFTVCLWGQTRNSKLAVMEIGDKTGKMPPEMLDNAAEYLRSKLVSSGRFVVISKERQMAVRIKELKKESYKECYDQKCQIPLGQALAADTILSTTITKMSGIYVITAELIDLSKEATIFGSTAQFDGSEEQLRLGLDRIAAELQNARPVMTATGKAVVYAIKFEANAPGAKAYLDGRLFCFNLPCEKDVEEGEHEIRITAPGYVAEEFKPLIDKSRVFSAQMKKDEAFLAITNADLIGDMAIQFDGAAIEKFPMPKRQVSPGKHTLVVESVCYEKLEGVIDLAPEEDRQMKAGLTPKKIALSVEATVAGAPLDGAQVLVDGVLIGTAPGPFSVPLCAKELVVRKPGYVDFWLPLAFKEGESFNAVATLDYQYETVYPYKWWGLGLLLGGAALVGGGIAFDVLADKEYDTYRDMSTPEAIEEAMKKSDFSRSAYDEKMKKVYDRGKTYDTLRIVGYAVGGAMAATGIVLMAIPEDVRVIDLEGFSVASHGDGVMLSFSTGF